MLLGVNVTLLHNSLCQIYRLDLPAKVHKATNHFFVVPHLERHIQTQYTLTQCVDFLTLAYSPRPTRNYPDKKYGAETKSKKYITDILWNIDISNEYLKYIYLLIVQIKTVKQIVYLNNDKTST